MPPKAKYTKEEILSKAIDIIVRDGAGSLTARVLAAELGTSVRPVFTAFKNMEEVRQCCFDFALQKYHSYFKDGLGDEPFKQIGRMYIKFAEEEPQLFQLIFFNSQKEMITFSEYMKKLDDEYNGTISLIQKTTGMNKKNATELYKCMWIFCTGIAVLCATGQCRFSEREKENFLNIACEGLVNRLNDGMNR